MLGYVCLAKNHEKKKRQRGNQEYSRGQYRESIAKDLAMGPFLKHSRKVFFSGLNAPSEPGVFSTFLSSETDLNNWQEEVGT